MIVLVIAFVIFVVFSNSKQTEGDGSQKGELPNATNADSNSSKRSKTDSDTKKQMPGMGRDSAKSGWSLDDVDSNRKSPSKKSAGGWSMEDVDTKPKKDGVDLKLTNPKSTQGKKQDSGWKIEDVDSSKKKDNDWKLEDVDKKK